MLTPCTIGGKVSGVAGVVSGGNVGIGSGSRVVSEDRDVDISDGASFVETRVSSCPFAFWRTMSSRMPRSNLYLNR